MTVLRRSLAALPLLAAAAGCTFPPLATPTPRITPSSSPTPSARPSPTPTPSSTPSSAPGDVPVFEGGEIIVTATDGLRVRQRPGPTSVVVAGLLPIGAEVEAIMGPIEVDGFGWYLVRDVDGRDPSFEEGWIAAGFEPDPFLRSSGRRADDSRVVASFALDGDAEYGPIEIADEHHLMRWAAIDPEGVRCRFGVTLAPAAGETVQAIRATVGTDIVPGTLQPPFFAAQPALRGSVFLSVESDCAWTLAVIRAPPPGDASPSPSPGG